MENELLIVHPYDKSTFFLDRIKNYLQSQFPANSHYFSIKPNEASHKECLTTISNFSSNGLILFMGHGKSNCLYGAKGDYFGTLENEEVKIESPEKYFYLEDFINKANLQVFNEKKVISLSCRSNEYIGRISIESGAKVFMGFGDLPTSKAELILQGEGNKSGISLSTIEGALKTEINYIMKKSIHIGILKRKSFSQLLDLIYFITNQKICYYLTQKKMSERKLIANYLYNFKNEIRIYGNKDEKLAF